MRLFVVVFVVSVGLIFEGYAWGLECERGEVDRLVEERGKGAEEVLRVLSEEGCVWSDYPLYKLVVSDGGVSEEGFMWLRRSARGGDERALKRLGSYYSFGLGVKKDLVSAYALYRISEELGGGKGSGFLAKKIGRNMREEERMRADRWSLWWSEVWFLEGKLRGGVLSEEEGRRDRLEP